MPHSRALKSKLSKLKVAWTSFDHLFEKLPENLRATRPNATEWSAVEILEHLIIVEERILSTLQNPPTGPSRTSLQKWRNALILAAVELPIRVKIPLQAIAPTGQIPESEIRKRRKLISESVETLCAQVAERSEHQTVFQHPRMGWFTYVEAVGFLGAHVIHHLHQLRRLKKALKSAGSN